MAVGKPKSASSKRDVPLNDTAVAIVEELRKESYFGPNSPLVADEKGNYTPIFWVVSTQELGYKQYQMNK